MLTFIHINTLNIFINVLQYVIFDFLFDLRVWEIQSSFKFSISWRYLCMCILILFFISRFIVSWLEVVDTLFLCFGFFFCFSSWKFFMYINTFSLIIVRAWEGMCFCLFRLTFCIDGEIHYVSFILEL